MPDLNHLAVYLLILTTLLSSSSLILSILILRKTMHLRAKEPALKHGHKSSVSKSSLQFESIVPTGIIFCKSCHRDFSSNLKTCPHCKKPVH